MAEFVPAILGIPSANARAVPGIHADLIATVRADEPLEFKPGAKLGRLVDGYDWLPVRVNGREGWMALVAPESVMFVTAPPDDPSELPTEPITPPYISSIPLPEMNESVEVRENTALLLEWLAKVVRNAPGKRVN